MGHLFYRTKFRLSSQGRKPGTKCGGRPVQGVWGTEVRQWGPGAKPGRGPGGRSPPEAEAILDFYMHNFDLILNYFYIKYLSLTL